MPLEIIDKKSLIDDGRILNLTAHDPQKWTTVIEVWSQIVNREMDKLDFTQSATEMYSFLEKNLGESARAIWEAYKKDFPDDFARDIELGCNPYNFTNKMALLILGDHPNVAYDQRQVEAIRQLKQLQKKSWMYIKDFLNDFMYYSSIAGCFYDNTIDEKLFLKLPEPLGKIIHKNYREKNTKRYDIRTM